ncbi:MAG: DNA-directed RNA polymerase subunit D [Candidatus Aenigmatarchaeota archaeon]
MHIDVVERKGNRFKVIMDETSPQFANALRRIAMTEVPVLAVESVDFYSNDSAMYDEVVAHRLGLVPLWFDAKNFSKKGECDCEGKGCSNCQIVFVIDKKGPCTVYSKDMKSADAEVAKPLLEDIPLIELAKDEKFKVEMTARLGTGDEHAKWQAAKAWYMGWPTIVDKEGKVLVEPCMEHALMMEGSGILPVKAYQDGKCKVKGEVGHGARIANSASKIIFTIESISGLKAEEILAKSVEILRDKAKDFGKEVGKL